MGGGGKKGDPKPLLPLLWGEVGMKNKTEGERAKTMLEHRRY